MQNVAVRKPAAVLGSTIWFVLAPVAAAGLAPWWLTGWQPGRTFWPLQAVGWLLVAAGAAAVVHAFARFVTEGRGTPVPIAPPERLVIGGLYRFVRNPMYVSVLALIIGQALILGRLNLWLYAAAFLLASIGFVHFYEEPTLRKRFGTDYDRYRRAVPGWLPRWRPWTSEYPEHE